MRRAGGPQQLVVLVIIALTALMGCSEAVQWLGLYKQKSLTDQDRGTLLEFCNAMKRQSIFGSSQYNFCKKRGAASGNVNSVSALIEASKQTLSLCRTQFKRFRWNCSVLKQVPQLAPELRTLTAEQALVHALSSFVLTTTFANDCARGVISSCACGSDPDWLFGKRPDMRFKFDGCHTNLKMGQKLAQKFLGAGRASRKRPRVGRRSDRGGRGESTRMANVYRQFATMVNTHNYRVGIQVTRHSEAVRCKCHGTSASCAIRTCQKVLHKRAYQIMEQTYIRLSEEDPVDILLNMYDKQKLRKTVFDENGYQGYEERCTEADREAGSNPLGSKPKCDAYKVIQGLPKSDVLLFQEHSLDYCTMREGIYPGTHNRECFHEGSRDAAEILRTDSSDRRREILCSVMCCGRPYRNAAVTYPGEHPECPSKSCRLLNNPFRVECQPCVLTKAFCS